MFRQLSIPRIAAVAGAFLAACSGGGHAITPQFPTPPLSQASQTLSVPSAIVHSGAFWLYKVPVPPNPGNELADGLDLANGVGNTLWFVDCGGTLPTIYRLSAGSGAVAAFSPTAQYISLSGLFTHCPIASINGYLFYFLQDNTETAWDLARVSSGGSFAFADFTPPQPLNQLNEVVDVTLGPDARIWYLSHTNAQSTYVSSISASGVAGPSARLPEVVSVRNPFCPHPNDYNGIAITSGSDSNLYVTAHGQCAPGHPVNAVLKISTTASIAASFRLPNVDVQVGSLVSGPDGNLWILEPGLNKIERMTTAGTQTEFSLPAGDSGGLSGIARGTDGALWFTEAKANRIGRITTSGAITRYAVPFTNSEPLRIISCPSPTTTTECGPHGGVWISSAIGILRFDFP